MENRLMVFSHHFSLPGLLGPSSRSRLRADSSGITLTGPSSLGLLRSTRLPSGDLSSSPEICLEQGACRVWVWEMFGEAGPSAGWELCSCKGLWRPSRPMHRSEPAAIQQLHGAPPLWPWNKIRRSIIYQRPKGSLSTGGLLHTTEKQWK